MGLFSHFRKRSPAGPHPDWPWTLTIGGTSTARFTWADIDRALRELEPDTDSFLILEQKDPADDRQYWYLQCAIACQGPNAGHYIVGCGFSGEDGRKESRKYYERILPWVGDVIPFFQAVHRGEALDLSPFTDQTEILF